MRDMHRRIEKLEAKLGVGQESKPHVLIIPMVYKGGKYLVLPEAVELWITYQAKAADGSKFIVLYAGEEVAARIKAGSRDLDIFGTWKSIHDEEATKNNQIQPILRK